jgi:hypothetical protein
VLLSLWQLQCSESHHEAMITEFQQSLQAQVRDATCHPQGQQLLQAAMKLDLRRN